MKNITKNFKFKYHAWRELNPLCGQYFLHNTGIASSDKTVTCKRCKKIIKNENDFTRKVKNGNKGNN